MMNRKVLFVKVAAVHVLILGLLFGLMNGCERKRRADVGLPQVASPPPAGGPEKAVPKKEIVEKEEPLVIKEYGKPGAVKSSEIVGEAQGEVRERVHKVEKGETLSRIAQDYRVSMKAIMKLNNIKDPSKIRAGQELIIPGG